MLAQLATLRRSAAHPAPAVPIADHALLSDQRTVALVAYAGARCVYGFRGLVQGPL